MPAVRYLRTMICGVPVVAAPAEIDITTAEQLRAVLQSADRGYATVVVDMTRTRFCDLAGLTVLIQEHERAASGGGELRRCPDGCERHRTGHPRTVPPDRDHTWTKN